MVALVHAGAAGEARDVAVQRQEDGNPHGTYLHGHPDVQRPADLLFDHLLRYVRKHHLRLERDTEPALVGCEEQGRNAPLPVKAQPPSSFY